MNPNVDLDLHGAMSSLLRRLADDGPRDGDWEMIAKWRCSRTELTGYLDFISTIDKFLIEASLKAQESTTKESYYHVSLENEIMCKKAQRKVWEVASLKAVAFDLLKEAERLKQEERQLKIRASIMETQNKILTSTLFQREKTIKDLETRTNTLEAECKRKIMEMERAREKDEAKKSLIETEHNRECCELRLKAQEAEARYTNFTKVFLESLKTALPGIVSQSSQREQEISEIRPIPAQSTSLAAEGQNEDTNCSIKLEGNMELQTQPRDSGGLMQTEMKQEKEQVGYKRRKTQPPVAPATRQRRYL